MDKYQPNPQMRNAAAKFGQGTATARSQKPSVAAKVQEQPQSTGGHAHKHVLHHPNGAENPSPGMFHSELHKEDGTVEETDHDTFDDAMETARPQMEDSAASADDPNGGFGHGEEVLNV